MTGIQNLYQLSGKPHRIYKEPCELPDVQASFRKGRRARDQIAKFDDILDHQKSKRVPEKYLFLLY